MTRAQDPPSISEAVARVASIDLSRIRRKLASPDIGDPMDSHAVEKACQEYKQFLILSLIYDNRIIVPSIEADRVWHQHILDTHAYAADTERVFGFFLHHFPYLGTGGPDDAKRLRLAWEDTQRLLNVHFRVSNSTESSCSSCGRATMTY